MKSSFTYCLTPADYTGAGKLEIQSLHAPKNECFQGACISSSAKYLKKISWFFYKNVTFTLQFINFGAALINL